MKQRLNVAVIGSGIGRVHVEEGYAPNGDKFRVKAICDLDQARMTRLADEFAIEHRLSEFDAVLAMDDIDIVDVCTPPSLHFSMVMAALRAGKHVVCEKPLVGSLREVDAVMEAEKSSAGMVMPIFQYRFGNGIEQARAVIQAGIAGKPYAGTVETMWRREADYYEVPWRGKWKTELGGVLMGHAIHSHDIFSYLMGDIESLFGRVATRVNAIEVEDTISVSLKMSSGALASFTATLGSVDEITRIRLQFEHVTIESDHAPYHPGAGDWKILPRTDAIGRQIGALLSDWTYVPSGFQTQMARFYEAIAGQRPLPVTSADARRALELVAATYHSAATRAEVNLPLGADHPLYDSWVPEEFR